MVLNCEDMKHSVYCCILMDSNHSAMLLKGMPSDPLVLGRRMEILWGEESTVWGYTHCQHRPC